MHTSNGLLNVYDLKNKLVAYSAPVGEKEIRHLVCAWGFIMVIQNDGKAFYLSERDTETKLQMLFRKNLYSIAINLTQDENGRDTAETADVLRLYGDHLYLKQVWFHFYPARFTKINSLKKARGPVFTFLVVNAHVSGL